MGGEFREPQMEGGKGGKKKLAESWSGEGLYCITHRVPECLSRKREYLPLGPRGGGNTSLRMRVWGEPILPTGQKAWHSVYFVVGSEVEGKSGKKKGSTLKKTMKQDIIT